MAASSLDLISPSSLPWSGINHHHPFPSPLASSSSSSSSTRFFPSSSIISNDFIRNVNNNSFLLVHDIDYDDIIIDYDVYYNDYAEYMMDDDDDDDDVNDIYQYEYWDEDDRNCYPIGLDVTSQMFYNMMYEYENHICYLDEEEDEFFLFEDELFSLDEDDDYLFVKDVLDSNDSSNDIHMNMVNRDMNVVDKLLLSFPSPVRFIPLLHTVPDHLTKFVYSSTINQHQSTQQQPNFLLPQKIQPSQVVRPHWRHDYYDDPYYDTDYCDSHSKTTTTTTSEPPQVVDDTDIFVVGLPSSLLHEFRSYFASNGMMETIEQLLYRNNDSDDNDNTATTTKVITMKDGYKWSAKHANHWNTDMIWFDPINEVTYESFLSVLRRSNFDAILQSIQQYLFGTSGGGGGEEKRKLVVHGLGGIFLSYFYENPPFYSHLHRDVPETRGAFYNILIPVYLPEDDSDSEGESTNNNGSRRRRSKTKDSTLYIGGQKDGICSLLHLQYNTAIVVGSDSWHGTGPCDYRSLYNKNNNKNNTAFRFSMSIWVSEITEDSVDVIATDDMTGELSPWPRNGDRAWYMAQKGRQMGSSENDQGRSPLPLSLLQDQRSDCKQYQHKCDTDLYGIRVACPKTCQIYMNNNEYYAYLNALKRNESVVAAKAIV